MQSYIRVISDSATDGAPELRAVIVALRDSISGVSERSPLKPHPRGGFSLHLEFPDDQLQVLLEYLRDNGWMPSI